MIVISVQGAIKDAKELTAQLTGNQLAVATVRAINRCLLKGRTIARQAVKAIYNIPQRNLDGVNIEKANRSNLTGYIYASAKPIPMDAFNPQFTYQTASGEKHRLTKSKKGIASNKSIKRGKVGTGVTIEVFRGKKETIPFAFMLPGGKPRVFARGMYKPGSGAFGFIRRFARVNSTGNDTPIKPLISVTVHGAVINPVVMGNISTKVTTDFKDELEHAIKSLGRNLPA